jgi:predicted dehydrogenase
MRVMSKRIKIGLIGCGRVAVKRHLPALKSLEEAEVVAAADVDETRLNHVTHAFRIEKRFVDYMAVLQDPAVEAVAICVPLQFHCEVALAALDAGKHVLLEKPLAMSLDEADRLIGRAAKTDRKVLVGFNKRWHRLVRRAREIVRQGRLGQVGLVNTICSSGHDRRNIPAWRLRRHVGGGNLIENGSHFYDMWHFLLQTDVEEILASSLSTEQGDDEPGIVTARTADGVFLNCVLSDALPNRNEVEIFGQNCILRVSLHRFDGLEFIPLHSCAGDVRNRLRNMAHFFKELPRGILEARHGGDYNGSFRAQWQHFIDCIRRDIPVECALEDGRRALQVALAAVKSVSKGQPVKVAQAPREILPVAPDSSVESQGDWH